MYQKGQESFSCLAAAARPANTRRRRKTMAGPTGEKLIPLTWEAAREWAEGT